MNKLTNPLPPSVLEFLKDIKKHNNREWFNKHKEKYIAENENMIAFADKLLAEMKKHDNIETESGKKSLFRIYKDVRFSKDKSPYKTHFAGHLKRATKYLRGGYYFHIEPGNSFVGGGFWAPTPEDLKCMREGISRNYDELDGIISDKTFVKTFAQLDGEKLKTAPKGFDKDHPAIELLKHKQFLISHKFTDKEVLSADFVKKVNEAFKNMRPFFDFMSEVLTTDANGEPLF